ncbi:unnamed protein product, partial [Rotaria socialis]
TSNEFCVVNKKLNYTYQMILDICVQQLTYEQFLALSGCIHLTQEDTTSSSSVYIKNLFMIE